jgi:hypothetical protein
MAMMRMVSHLFLGDVFHGKPAGHMVPPRSQERVKERHGIPGRVVVFREKFPSYENADPAFPIVLMEDHSL